MQHRSIWSDSAIRYDTLMKDLYAALPGCCKLKVVRDKHGLDRNDRSLCLLTNTGEQMSILNIVSERAHKMLASKAYLHHYEKYGLGEMEIVDYLTVIESIINNYAALK